MFIEVRDGVLFERGRELLKNETVDLIRRAGFGHERRFMMKYKGRTVMLSNEGKILRTMKTGSLKKYAGVFDGMRTVIRPKGVRWLSKRMANKAKGWTRVFKSSKVRLRSVSPTRAKINAIYSALKLLWWPLHSRCEFVNPGGVEQCRRRSSPSPHHKKGRGRFLCDVTSWMAVCWQHHRWIHDHPAAAKLLGYLLPQFFSNTEGAKLPPIITPPEHVK